MNHPYKPKNDGKDIIELKRWRNSLLFVGALIAFDAFRKSNGMMDAAFIPAWASWILATVLLVAAGFTALQVIGQEM